MPMCIRQNVLYETLASEPPTYKSKKFHYIYKSMKPAKFHKFHDRQSRRLGKEASLKKCLKGYYRSYSKRTVQELIQNICVAYGTLSIFAMSSRRNNKPKRYFKSFIKLLYFYICTQYSIIYSIYDFSYVLLSP